MPAWKTRHIRALAIAFAAVSLSYAAAAQSAQPSQTKPTRARIAFSHALPQLKGDHLV